MKVMEWLTSQRKLDAALLEYMGVKEVDHKSLGQAAAFPYRKDGNVYAGKFRSMDKRWSSTTGIARGLFNADVLEEMHDQPVVITEGEIDALSCIQAGFARSVSLPDGWTEYNGKTQSLVDAEEGLRRSPWVVVAGDNDKAGSGLPRAVANVLRGHDVRYVEWPNGCKDANDVLVKYGEGEVAKCLNEAKTLDPAGGFVTSISDMPPMPDRRVLRTGMRLFDYVIAYELGTMSVATGIPGYGKSTFTTFAAYHVAKNENIRVGFMSFETHPHQIRDHLCRLHTGQSFADLRDKEAFMHDADRLFRIVHRTYDDIPSGHNLGWLHDMVYTLAVRDQCKLVIVDPWNELEHMPEHGESLTNYINFALQQIRTWASKYNCHIQVVAHPKKIDGGEKPRAPTGYDIADSAAWSNKPSLGLTVHQEQKDGFDIVRIIAWKVRETQLYGFTKGSIALDFLPEKMAYKKHE